MEIKIAIGRLSRPCAMVIPDFELICEIMLVAEGFIDARLLARKFICLYTLCKELLSKQVHEIHYCQLFLEENLSYYWFSFEEIANHCLSKSNTHTFLFRRIIMTGV